MGKNINETPLMKCIEELIKGELEKASQKFGVFNSPHEGYAVINEEYDESYEEFYCIKDYLDYLWKAVKENNITEQRVRAVMISINAKRAIYELIQTAAMADRYIVDIKDK